MALPPTIPTSFVPPSPAAARQRYRFDFGNVFAVFAYGLLLVMLGMAVAVFLYAGILDGQKASKDVELTKALGELNKERAESFVILESQLSAGQQLLNEHVAFTGFFEVVETLLPSTVRFSTLRLSIIDENSATIEAAGIAKTFNALAAASASLAGDGRIRDAIFSRISVNKDNTVSFSLTAKLKPELIMFSASAAPEASLPEPAPAPAEEGAPVTP